METVNEKSITYKVSQILFLMGVFLKQFYLFSSGGFQLGDFCFMASFLIVILFVLRLKIPLANGDGFFIGFVVCVALINLIYMCIHGSDYPGEFRFHKSTIYYVYNLFIILTFRRFSTDRDFLKILRLVLQAGLLVQLVISFTGLGRYGSMRYMGTFNDPNQCGFFVLSSFLMVFVISQITEEGHPFIWYIIALYLIVRTVSTGMLLGMVFFVLVYVFVKLFEFNKNTAYAFVTIAIGLFVVLVLYLTGVLHLPARLVNSTMFQRVLSKMWSFGVGTNAVSSGGIRNLFIDRCWDRLLDYPFKILYGAGEGYYSRFPSARFVNNEVHSSILGPLFYYGIIPCTIWFIWMFKQLKGIKRELWAAYIALIIESVTLVNNRQPFFWMIFVLAGSCLAKASYKADHPAEELTAIEGD